MSLTLVKGDERTELLSSVTVPAKFYNRLKTGNDVVDAMFGGDEMPGILPGACVMATGTPGAGKTTFMLQLADSLSLKEGRTLLYNANEESKAMVKLAADRIKIKGQFQIKQLHDVNQVIKHVLDEGIEVLVQDSLQTLSDGQLQGQRLLKSVCRKLVRLSKDHDVTVFVIGQVTKGGHAAGPMALVHEVDVHMHLSRDKESGNRILTLEKNRFGPAGVPYEFSLSAHGLDFKVSEAPVEPTQGSLAVPSMSRQAERKHEVLKLIREKLEAGEMLSGYCFERLGVDCSGGYWRGMLRLVVEQLKREGRAVGEARVDGRLHNFLEKAVA
ncbi:MAG: AAA family ATPase [Acidobacteriaceae bacterium]|nr:AAA family ATPase [Acidobacteriaceae bacterium]